jgi:hypothetical protein
LKNGFLTVRRPVEIVCEILAALGATPGLRIAVDLEQTVTLPDGKVLLKSIRSPNFAF